MPSVLLITPPPTNTHHAHADESRLYRVTSPSEYSTSLSAASIARYDSIGPFHTPCAFTGISNCSVSSPSPWCSQQQSITKPSPLPPSFPARLPRVPDAQPLQFVESGTAGFLHPQKMVALQQKLFLQMGRENARIHFSVVTGLDRCEDGSVVVTSADGRRHQAKVVLLACGAFTNTIPISPALGLPSPVLENIALKTQSVVYFRISPEDASKLPSCTIIYAGPTKGMGDSEIAEDSFYYVPPVNRDDGTVWAKMGHGKELEQTLSPSTSAEVIDRWYEHGDAANDARCLEVIESQFRQFFPNVYILEATLNRNGVTMDTDDGRVACRMLGEDGAVAVCAGCNGGGAKLSDEVGRLCAEMVLEALGKKKRAPSRKPKPKSWWHTEDPYYDDTESPQIGCGVG
ncbi:hypothetical protein TeGR_g10285 [Tetraparma gracilis]|uniref:FAD dependent oxidoreductase domain-containing protein n=1 Tax=Tetraparma gracilis TaxID=2962635 RepID=A0ABQ6MRB2_9STRA|nr:hypothetical protein TeGR_g10285 [Tetraparma gracilis]